MLCSSCLADRYPQNGAGPDAELLGGRVDLIQLISEGIPDREYVPGADWLIKGKRYLTVASAGIGKTLATSVVAVEIVINGGTVVVLDVENGADEYARRLEDILEAREDTEEAMSACTKRLRYYEYPALSLRWSDGEWITACAGADLVIFDSSRRVLSSVGLAEDTSDDYAKFVERLIIPLNRVGITTLILDNTGHENTDRARGTKAKEDLNEVIFSLNVAEDFDADTTGKLIWRRTRQRFSGVPLVMAQHLGGGTYALPTELETEDVADGDEQKFRPTGYMEKVSHYVEFDDGCSQHKIVKAVGGKERYIVQAIQSLVDEGYIRREPGPRNSQLHRSITPYREAEDDLRPTSAPTSAPSLPVEPSAPPPLTSAPPTGGRKGGGRAPPPPRPTPSPLPPRVRTSVGARAIPTIRSPDVVTAAKGEPSREGAHRLLRSPAASRASSRSLKYCSPMILPARKVKSANSGPLTSIPLPLPRAVTCPLRSSRSPRRSSPQAERLHPRDRASPATPADSPRDRDTRLADPGLPCSRSRAT